MEKLEWTHRDVSRVVRDFDWIARPFVNETVLEGMDSLDHEGTLAEMGSLLKQGRLQWRDKAAFFARVSQLLLVLSVLSDIAKALDFTRVSTY